MSDSHEIGRVDAKLQTEIPMTSGRSNLKGEVELFQYGGLLFHTAGTGFVQYYISLKFSRKTANIGLNLKKLSFYNNV